MSITFFNLSHPILKVLSLQDTYRDRLPYMMSDNDKSKAEQPACSLTAKISSFSDLSFSDYFSMFVRLCIFLGFIIIVGWGFTGCEGVKNGGDLGYTSNSSTKEGLSPENGSRLDSSVQPLSFRTFTGRTMGTTYTVKYFGGAGENVGAMQENIDVALAAFNQIFSTYEANSEITKLNERLRQTPLGRELALSVSDVFMEQLEKAVMMSRFTGGHFDVTIAPLVALWGFGVGAETGGGGGASVPTAEMIEERLARVGYDQLRLDEGRRKVVFLGGMALDFSAIAKGRGVDRLGVTLENAGITHYLVEIGGELRSSGHKLENAMESAGAPRGIWGLAWDSLLEKIGRWQRKWQWLSQWLSKWVKGTEGTKMTESMGGATERAGGTHDQNGKENDPETDATNGSGNDVGDGVEHTGKSAKGGEQGDKTNSTTAAENDVEAEFEAEDEAEDDIVLGEVSRRWTLSIVRPEANARLNASSDSAGKAREETIKIVLPLEVRGIATSGNYHNYVVKAGVRYPHIVDPETGYPVKHGLASVTVIASDCEEADALATALMVMGGRKGLAFAEKHDLAVYFIEENDNRWMSYASTAFKPYLEHH